MSFDPTMTPAGSFVCQHDQGDMVVLLPGGGVRRITILPNYDRAQVIAVQYSGGRVHLVTTEIKIEERD